MKVNSFLIFVCFVCCCQAHVAARWPQSFKSLGIVRRQADESQTAPQQPEPGQDNPSQQDKAQPNPQQQQGATEDEQDKPLEQNTAQQEFQEQGPATGQSQQGQLPQSQNGQTADESQNQQQNAGDLGVQDWQSEGQQAQVQPTETQLAAGQQQTQQSQVSDQSESGNQNQQPDAGRFQSQGQGSQGQQTQGEAGGQQTGVAGQGSPTQAQQPSGQADITGGATQSRQTAVQQDQNLRGSSTLGEAPATAQPNTVESGQPSDRAQASPIHAEPSATGTDDGGSLGAFGPLPIALKDAADSARGNIFLQQTQSSGDFRDEAGSTGGLGQVTTAVADRATTGVQQPSAGSVMTGPSSTGSPIPHFGQCGGTYNGGASGQCAEGSQCICKDSTYCQCRTPNTDGSYTPTDENWSSAWTLGGGQSTGGVQSNGGIGGPQTSGGIGDGQSIGGAQSTDGVQSTAGPQSTGGGQLTGGVQSTSGTQSTGGGQSTGGVLSTAGPQSSGGAKTSSGSPQPTGNNAWALSSGGPPASKTSYPPPSQTGELPAAGPTNDYHCDGVASQKKDLYNQGGTAQDYAIGSLENFDKNCGSNTLQSNYEYGDGKSGSSTNCGAYKNNLASIRESCTDLSSTYSDDGDLCNHLNSNLKDATSCQHQQIDKLGQQGFYQYQRCGHVCTSENTGCGDKYPNLTCEQGGKDYEAAITHNTGVVESNPNNDYTGGYILYAI